MKRVADDRAGPLEGENRVPRRRSREQPQPIVPKERYGGGPIVISEYDGAWPRMFDAEQKRLERAIGSVTSRIEHIGSTAVPGLAAKPIIDLLVGVHDVEASRSALIAGVQALGYTHMSAYEVWLPGEILFRRIVDRRWTHHVHVAHADGPEWDDYLQVRDYLRRHPGVAREYGTLKRSLAATYGDDIDGFRNAKRPFVRTLLRIARSQESNHGGCAHCGQGQTHHG